MIVTLTDYTPPIREDDTAWTTALLYEAALQTGPFILIDTFTLSPVDADPSNPATRSFTTDEATIQTGGWYQLVWQDASTDQASTPPVQNLASPRAWRPLVSDVGQLLSARTVDSNGTRQGTFTADTSPTYQQAMAVVDKAVSKLEAKFGPVMLPELVGSAQNVVALRAAMLVELSYFGDQINAGRSPYAQLEELYKEAIADWFLERRSLGGDDLPDTGDDTSGNAMPRSTFPAPSNFPSDATTGRGVGWEGVIW